MMVLVIGGSGSGKSAYAEKAADSFFKENNVEARSALRSDMTGSMKKYYLATMQILDEEGRKKVERHRRLRDGKGFVTIEQPTDICRALDRMETGERTVLLECISNLAANEMFSGEEAVAEKEVVDKIISEIEVLQRGTTHFVVVSNNVFEDGINYEEATMAYIRVMGAVNRELATMADRVVEVVAGIPIMIKEQD
ncbi:MAG: cobinamide kinase [Lachnospiraceae bacterium]|nr:cobinamide kinase [Lachnospiraceae bacterium]